MIEQFFQLTSSSNEPGTFLSQPEVNPKGHASSSSGNIVSQWGKWMQWYFSALVEIHYQQKSPNKLCWYSNQFSKILLLLLHLQKLVHLVSQGMLLMVPPMILILIFLLSHRLRKRSLKRKTPLIQLTLHLLRVLLLLLLLLLRKSICLYLLFPIGLRRKIKLMVTRCERPSLKSKSISL